MLFFKACGRCHGDLNEGQDRFGKYVQCVQCARITETDQRNFEGQTPQDVPVWVAPVWPSRNRNRNPKS